jgi:NAD(P)-dependent dehydrogenase (short-subunit alcohol dehydrogenase family)
MRRAIVTGSTRGIGLAIAKALLTAGDRVVITGRTASRVDAALTELRQLFGDRVVGLVLDVRDRQAVERVLGDAAARFGGLDVVVNNAGVGLFRSVETMSDAEWSEVFDTNVTGVFFMTRAAIPALRASGGGWIINIASLAGRNPFANGGAYCASKAALISFSDSVMQEVRFDNIRVSVIMPGSVATEFSGSQKEDDWKLSGDDVAEVVIDLLRHPQRSLPSRVEIRPSKPKKG